LQEKVEKITEKMLRKVAILSIFVFRKCDWKWKNKIEEKLSEFEIYTWKDR
jgi:hypothetical protein